jgi:hypothetical protein
MFRTHVARDQARRQFSIAEDTIGDVMLGIAEGGFLKEQDQLKLARETAITPQLRRPRGRF